MHAVIIHRPVVYLKAMFRRLDYISIFRWNLLRWIKLEELVSVSGLNNNVKNCESYTYLLRGLSPQANYTDRATAAY
jgi:hypothetical protein